MFGFSVKIYLRHLSLENFHGLCLIETRLLSLCCKKPSGALGIHCVTGQTLEIICALARHHIKGKKQEILVRKSLEYIYISILKIIFFYGSAVTTLWNIWKLQWEKISGSVLER